jgi:hypothetical protein
MVAEAGKSKILNMTQSRSRLRKGPFAFTASSSGNCFSLWRSTSGILASVQANLVGASFPQLEPSGAVLHHRLKGIILRILNHSLSQIGVCNLKASLIQIVHSNSDEFSVASLVLSQLDRSFDPRPRRILKFT